MGGLVGDFVGAGVGKFVGASTIGIKVGGSVETPGGATTG